MNATEVGAKIGRAMARDVLAENMPSKWMGLDPQDADIATDDGINPDTTEWVEMNSSAKKTYLSMVGEPDWYPEQSEMRPGRTGT